MWNLGDDDNEAVVKKDAAHPLNNLCRDLVFSAQEVGSGLDLDIERFKRTQDEKKKKRKVMGQSAWRSTWS